MKKLILTFAIALSGIIVSCNNNSTTDSTTDLTTDSIIEEVDSIPCVDSCTCDTICVDTCSVCNSEVTE